MRPPMELNAGVWSNLSSELLEQVLPFVPVLDLCRFRSVCKRWDSLIRTPDFGALCVRNAATGVTNGACLVAKLQRIIYSVETTHTLKESSRWSICDLSTKRWFTVKDELLESFSEIVMDMDAGLVCVFGDAMTDEQREASTIRSFITSAPQMLTVSNVIEQRVKVLPSPPGRYINPRRASLQLVVDPISQEYRVFFITPDHSWHSDDQSMHVYNSSTNQWKVSPNPPERSLGSRRHACSVVYQGALYVLFSNSKGPTSRLLRYSFVEEKWEDTGVIQRLWKVWKRGQVINSCNLVVSDNRLFLMTYCIMYHLDPKPWPLDISEIFLEQKLGNTVAQLPPEELYQYFGIVKGHQPYHEMLAVGFDKSILLTLEEIHGGANNYMLYNLVTKSWESLPPYPVERLRLQRGHAATTWQNVKHMSYLRLPNTPWG